MLFGAVILVLGSFLAGAHAQCQPGGLYWPTLGKCYYFRTDTPHTWDFKNAEERCRSLYGGHLVSIKSAFESTIISRNAKKTFDGQYWIGLTDMYGSGDWTWMDGSNVTYTNWADDFPMHTEGMTCVGSSSSTGKWFNTYCSEEEPFEVCETLVSPPTRVTASSATSPKTGSTRSTTTPSTPAGSPWDGPSSSIAPAHCQQGALYSPALGKCYYFLSGSRNFKDAEEGCQYFYGGHLVSIKSTSENNIINDNANEIFDGSYWIGLIDKYGSGDWTWMDGSKATYTNWADDYPMDDEENKCVSSSSSTGTWFNTYCNNERDYAVCEVLLSPPISTTVSSVPAQCQPGGLHYPALGKCYYFRNEHLNFKSAEEQCQSLYGGHLVSIKSYSENDIINDNANEIFDGSYWIGLIDIYGTDDWTWMDGSYATYTNWADDYPTDDKGEPCVESSRSTGKWFNTYCSYELNVVCETVITDTGSTTTRSTRSTMTRSTMTRSTGSTMASTITTGLLILCPLLQAVLK